MLGACRVFKVLKPQQQKNECLNANAFISNLGFSDNMDKADRHLE